MVAPGPTVFRAARPIDQTHYSVHARYDDDKFEFLTLCYDVAAPDHQLNWRVIVPPRTGGGSTC